MLNCLIVDDEPIARDLLEKYVVRTPGLQSIGKLDNALEVIDFVANHQVDVLLLDINMPEFSGMELLRALHHRPSVILTTAYSEYGAESYEYGVVDYLMKPVSFERFLKAIQKVNEVPRDLTSKPEVIRLKADGQIHQLDVASILFIEAFGNYIKVHTADNVLLIRKPLAEIEHELGDQAVRVHKSYLVIPQHILRMEVKKVVLKGDQELPLGGTYRRNVERFLIQS